MESLTIEVGGRCAAPAVVLQLTIASDGVSPSCQWTIAGASLPRQLTWYVAFCVNVSFLDALVTWRAAPLYSRSPRRTTPPVELRTSAPMASPGRR